MAVYGLLELGIALVKAITPSISFKDKVRQEVG